MCISKIVKHSVSSCPLCRRQISKVDLFLPPPKYIPDFFKSNRQPSSKLIALLRLLEESRTQNPHIKSVIFSNFSKLLFLLEKALEKAGFKTLLLDGETNEKRQAKVTEEFSSVSAPRRPMVLLSSLKASGTGLNLTAASYVYFMEPLLDVAVEEQALNCVYQIGQSEAVKVIKLIATVQRVLGSGVVNEQVNRWLVYQIGGTNLRRYRD
ncbi:hypothetical protein R6Q57_009974 [Mikania cordata]